MKTQLQNLLTFFISLTILSGKKPNIIFLMSDDQSTYSMGCYGNPDVKTPYLDALSQDGITFDNHYVTTAICMASRANVMTGMYEYKTGCNFDHGHMLTNIWKKSYPVLLRNAGYKTAFAGKFGFDLTDKPGGKKLKLPKSDFDKWGGSPGQTSYSTAKNKSMAVYTQEYPHSTLAYGAFGRDFIKEHAGKGKPFCLSISFKAPHMPATPDPRFRDIYAGKAFQKPANFGRKYSEHFSEQSKQDRQYARFHTWHYSDNYNKVMATYNQQVYAIDQSVGMVRKALEETGEADNTVIIYTSDNGFFCGAHGYGSKVLPYEESSRVPLIIYDPRNNNTKKGLRSDALTGNIDFAPTILDLAGLKAPKNVDGISLVKIVENPEVKGHESLALINVWGSKTVSFAVVTPEHKLVYWPYAEGEFTACEEVYDLVNDPLELKNLSSSNNGAVINSLRKRYDTHLKHWNDHCVSFHLYQPYSIVFDRNTTWEEKALSFKQAQDGQAKRPTK